MMSVAVRRDVAAHAVCFDWAKPKMKILDHYRGMPFLYFFLSMLALILLSPLVEASYYGGWVVRILFTIMMAAAVYAASGRRSYRLIAFSLAVPWLVIAWLSDKIGLVETDVVQNMLIISLNIFVGCIILAKVIQAREVTLNILTGALGLYLLIAINWAVSYGMIEALMPGSFSAGGVPIPWHKFLYFSLTTITTLGYGDILPSGAFAQIWATMEAVTGVLYIAVLVARLVSLYKS